MGYRLSWLAVKGKSAAQLLDELGLMHTGKFEECPESDIVGADLRNGWYVVVANDGSDQFAYDANLKELSSGAELVAGLVNETSMCSIAEGWQDGAKNWSVCHASSEGILHLDVEGSLPSAFVAIRDQQIALQKREGQGPDRADHIFDIPVKLTQALTRFKYDEDIPGLPPEPFEVLAPRLPSQSPLFSIGAILETFGLRRKM